MREVTAATLIYKSARWLRFVLQQFALPVNDCRVRLLVVGNDANSDVMNSLDALRQEFEFDYVDHRNENPYAYNMGRVYAAHNRCMREAKTDEVILLNSDMAAADHWADELLAMRDEMPCIPTSLLIESGRLPSGLPDYVQDFGKTPETFDRAAFIQRATDLRNGTGRRRAGGLFMPVLFRKSEFFAAGAYHIQTKNHVLASDAMLFQKMERDFKLPHVTAMRSVVYHVQRGELEDDVA